MKYIITENRLHNLVDKFFIKRYGGLLRKEVNDENYTYFYDLENGKPFEMNMGGTLWVGDYTLYRQIRSVLGFNNSEEVDEFFKNYFNDRYDVDIKRVASEGGYHREGDDLDYADPWMDEFNEESIIAEEKKDGILKLPYDVFDNDWDALQEFLRRRGNPQYALKGDVDLSERKDIVTLGNLIEVYGDLNLRFSSIESLGDLTKVGRTLNITGTPIKSLDNVSYVGFTMAAGKSLLKSLGALKYVGDDLYLKNTPFSRMANYDAKDKIRKKIIVLGTIFLGT